MEVKAPMPQASRYIITDFLFPTPSKKSWWKWKLLFLLLFWLSPLESATLRHLYFTFQHDPTTTITVNLQALRAPENLVLYYDTEPHQKNLSSYRYQKSGPGKKSLKLPDNRKFYHVELENLQPDTLYYFVVGDGTAALSEEILFRTFPGKDKPLRFVEGGDWEDTAQALKLAQRAATFSPHATLLGGDYSSYALQTQDYQAWDRWLDGYTKTMITKEGVLIPMIMAMGNHEVRGGFGKTACEIPFFLDYFAQGEERSSFFSLPLNAETHLFVLDSGHAATHEGKQLEWLKKEAQKFQEKKVKIALYHVPLYPSLRFFQKTKIFHFLHAVVSSFYDAPTAAKLFSPASFQGRRHWLPLFDHYHFTVAFEHHDQTLKRTKLLYHGKEDPQGTLYLGDGCWGVEKQYPPLQGYLHPYFAHLQGKVHFFWLVDIEKENIHYKAISTAGEILDAYTQKILTSKTR